MPNLLRHSCLLVICILIVGSSLSVRAGEVTLEDHSLRVAFDSDSGALTRFENKTTHWVIERRPELGVSFRLYAPLPNRRYNPVFGPKQHAIASVEKNFGTMKVRLQWKDLVSENGGVFADGFHSGCGFDE